MQLPAGSPSVLAGAPSSNSSFTLNQSNVGLLELRKNRTKEKPSEACACSCCERFAWLQNLKRENQEGKKRTKTKKKARDKTRVSLQPSDFSTAVQ